MKTNKQLIESLQYFIEKTNSQEVVNKTKRNVKIGNAILAAGALALGGGKLLAKGGKKAINNVTKFKGNKTTPFRGTPKPHSTTNITANHKNVQISPRGAKTISKGQNTYTVDHTTGKHFMNGKRLANGAPSPRVASLDAQKTKKALKSTEATQKALADKNHVWEF